MSRPVNLLLSVESPYADIAEETRLRLRREGISAEIELAEVFVFSGQSRNFIWAPVSVRGATPAAVDILSALRAKVINGPAWLHSKPALLLMGESPLATRAVGLTPRALATGAAANSSLTVLKEFVHSGKAPRMKDDETVSDVLYRDRQTYRNGGYLEERLEDGDVYRAYIIRHKYFPDSRNGEMCDEAIEIAISAAKILALDACSIEVGRTTQGVWRLMDINLSPGYAGSTHAFDEWIQLLVDLSRQSA